MGEKNNFILYSDCIPVKGFNRSIICDTRNDYFYLIPNSLYDILKKYNGNTLDYIFNNFDENDIKTLREYFDFLIENNLIFFTDRKKNEFPEISLDWYSPRLIENAIIDFENKIHNYSKILSELDKLNCSYIQFRYFKSTTFEDIYTIAKFISDNCLSMTGTEFIIPYNDKLFIESRLVQLLNEFPRIHSLTFYNAPSNVTKGIKRNNMGYIYYSSDTVINEKSCGIIKPNFFSNHIKLISESQKFNSCLNRKIAIDRNGDIKNCPSMTEDFGNIEAKTLTEAIKHKDFKKYWNISKDDIEICKDCEFRYICTDCRAYVETPDNLHSKPLKCGYDPYTNEWREWSEIKLKKEAIKRYNLQEIIK